MPRFRQRLVIFLLLSMTALVGHANNVQFGGAELLEDMQTIELELSWENAWNLNSMPPYNHDAIWVFFKISKNGEPFSHLNLSAEPGLHSSSGNIELQIEAESDGKGVFLRMKAEAEGNVSSAKVLLSLAERLPAGDYEFRVFGLEMVYVPEGPFYIGDGQSNLSFADDDGSGPFYIADDSEIEIGNGAGSLSDTGDYAPAHALPQTWPKGYNGFYCMKYELSQAQYADFLNTLSLEQQAARTASDPEAAEGTLAMNTGSSARNGIRIKSPGWNGQIAAVYGHDLQNDGSFNGENDGQNRACNWLSWLDLAAYLDWAALRPMTEMEFEKAARGPEISLPLEFAWASDEVVDANTLVQDGTEAEFAADVLSGNAGLASHGYSGPQGPLRCGFAAGPATNRKSAGASHYGIMELSGNLWELCVTVNAEGLSFQVINGDGNLDTLGNADVLYWPAANGAGFRGGAWNSGIGPGFRDLAISDRFYAGLPPLNRRNTSGGRGVR